MINENEKEQIADNFSVISNQCMSNHSTEHRKHEKAARINHEWKVCTRKNKRNHHPYSTDHFKQCNGTDNFRVEIFYPVHALGKNIHGLEETISPPPSKD